MAMGPEYKPLAPNFAILGVLGRCCPWVGRAANAFALSWCDVEDNDSTSYRQFAVEPEIITMAWFMLNRGRTQVFLHLTDCDRYL
jgi:hypothetical protein